MCTSIANASWATLRATQLASFLCPSSGVASQFGYFVHLRQNTVCIQHGQQGLSALEAEQDLIDWIKGVDSALDDGKFSAPQVFADFGVVIAIDPVLSDLLEGRARNGAGFFARAAMFHHHAFITLQDPSIAIAIRARH
jgi:hypothetical protein